MATAAEKQSVAEKSENYTVEQIMDMSVDELKTVLTSLQLTPEGASKKALQTQVIKALFATAPSELLEKEEAPFAEMFVPPFVTKLAPELQLQWWLEERKRAESLEAYERKRAFENEQRALENEQEERKRALEREQRAAILEAEDLKLKAEQLKIEAEKERRLAEMEAEQRKRVSELEAEERLRAAEIELKRIELQLAQAANTPAPQVVQPPQAPTFRLDQAVKLLPRFNERNVEEYLLSFEKVAQINAWPQDRYAAILQSTLVGKGLKVFSELSTADCQDYDTIKSSHS